MTTLSKSELRQAARKRRKALAHADYALAIAPYAEDLALAPGTIVGGYHALPEEADPALLLARLVETGCAVAFPRVTAKDQPLEFHHVPDGEVLEPGSFGIPEPLSALALRRCRTCCWCRCWPSMRRATGWVMAAAFTTAPSPR